LLGRGGSREGAFDIAMGCLLLIEDKGKNDTVLASYVPEAASQAIVLHKSIKYVYTFSLSPIHHLFEVQCLKPKYVEN
jgi:hypothetical protein